MQKNISLPHPSPTQPKRWPRIALVLTFLTLFLALVIPWPRPDIRTTTYRHVDGLQIGDAVYFRGIRIGHVRDLRPEGGHVRVEIEIARRYSDTLPPNPHFLLWRDELDPDRMAIRVQPGR